jgi:hypothetical protein
LSSEEGVSTAQIQSTATPVSPEAKQNREFKLRIGFALHHPGPSHSPLAHSRSPPLPSLPHPQALQAARPLPQTHRLCALHCRLLALCSLCSATRARPDQQAHATVHCPAPSTRQRQIKIKRDSSLPSAGTPDSIQCSAQPGFCDKKATSPLNARSRLGHRHNAQKSISTILPFWYSS